MSEKAKELISVATALTLKEGSVVDQLEGVVNTVEPQHNKSRPDGTEYTVQTIGLNGLDGVGHIHCSFYDHKPLDKYLGQTVVLLSVKSRNGRYGGVTIGQEAHGTSLFSKHKSRNAVRVSRVGEIHRTAATVQAR